MNQLVRLASPAVPVIVTAAGERASTHFLKFFAANICTRTRAALTTEPLRNSWPGLLMPGCRQSPPCSRSASPPGSRRRRASSPRLRSSNGSPHDLRYCSPQHLRRPFAEFLPGHDSGISARTSHRQPRRGGRAGSAARPRTSNCPAPSGRSAAPTRPWRHRTRGPRTERIVL